MTRRPLIRFDARPPLPLASVQRPRQRQRSAGRPPADGWLTFRLSARRGLRDGGGGPQSGHMGGRRAAIGESNQVLLAIGGGGGRVVAKLGQPAKLITPSRSSQAASFVSASMRLAEPFAQRR